MATTYGYADNKTALQTRLRRAEGQVRGIARMIDEDTYCIDILTQVSAVQAALDTVALELVRDHARHCLAADADEKADELVTALGRLLKR